jgi:hypothetical protein
VALDVTTERIEVGILRELFRHLHAFRAAYEDDGVEELVDPRGTSWNLFDLEYLYREGLPLLPERMWQAIELFLVRNIKESAVAVTMGISPTNPVAMYATRGLEKLVLLIEDGELPRFRLAPSWSCRPPLLLLRAS